MEKRRRWQFKDQVQKISRVFEGPEKGSLTCFDISLQSFQLFQLGLATELLHYPAHHSQDDSGETFAGHPGNLGYFGPTSMFLEQINHIDIKMLPNQPDRRRIRWIVRRHNSIELEPSTAFTGNNPEPRADIALFVFDDLVLDNRLAPLGDVVVRQIEHVFDSAIYFDTGFGLHLFPGLLVAAQNV